MLSSLFVLLLTLLSLLPQASAQASQIGAVTTLAGGTCGYADGLATSAMFSNSDANNCWMLGVAMDAEGTAAVVVSCVFLVQSAKPYSRSVRFKCRRTVIMLAFVV